MKSIVVYYSMNGNTEYVANKIKEELECDILKIEPVKEYPNKGFKKFMYGGMKAVMKQTPKLIDYKFDASLYDHIIIGLPVWASSITPPIRSFLQENKDSIVDKNISIFTSYSGGGADKVIESVKEYLGIDNFVAEMDIIDPYEKQSKEKDEKIIDFCKKIKRG